MKSEDCSFCAELSGDAESSLFHQITEPDFMDNIVWSDDDFAIVPSIGCFTEGYLLLIPRKHIASYSALSKEKMQKMSVIMQKIKAVLASAYGKPAVSFEHGSVLGCRIGGGGCVDHAHMHFIPANVPYSQYAEKNYSVIRIDDILHLTAFEERRMPYFYFSNPNGDMYVCDAPDAVSQYFRQVTTVHENLGNVWRWQSHPFLNKMEATYRKIKPYFANFIV